MKEKDKRTRRQKEEWGEKTCFFTTSSLIYICSTLKEKEKLVLERVVRGVCFGMIIVIFVLNSSFLSLSFLFLFQIRLLLSFILFPRSRISYFFFASCCYFVINAARVVTEVLFSFARLSPLVDLKVRFISMLFSWALGARATLAFAGILPLCLVALGLYSFCFFYMLVRVCVSFVADAVDEYCLDAAWLAPQSTPSLLSPDIVHFLQSCYTAIQQSARLDVLMNPLFIPLLSGCRPSFRIMLEFQLPLIMRNDTHRLWAFSGPIIYLRDDRMRKKIRELAEQNIVQSSYKCTCSVCLYRMLYYPNYTASKTHTPSYLASNNLFRAGH